MECCEYDYACHTTIIHIKYESGMLYHLHKFSFEESRKSEQMTEAHMQKANGFSSNEPLGTTQEINYNVFYIWINDFEVFFVISKK